MKTKAFHGATEEAADKLADDWCAEHPHSVTIDRVTKMTESYLEAPAKWWKVTLFYKSGELSVDREDEDQRAG